MTWPVPLLTKTGKEESAVPFQLGLLDLFCFVFVIFFSSLKRVLTLSSVYVCKCMNLNAHTHFSFFSERRSEVASLALAWPCEA